MGDAMAEHAAGVRLSAVVVMLAAIRASESPLRCVLGDSIWLAVDDWQVVVAHSSLQSL
jgi:hypothetical protein